MAVSAAGARPWLVALVHHDGRGPHAEKSDNASRSSSCKIQANLRIFVNADGFLTMIGVNEPAQIEPNGSGSSSWIGTPITPAQICAFLFVGIVSVTGMFLQPIVLGALVHEGRLSTAGIGPAATAEMLATGVTAMAAASLRPVSLRWWGGGASLALIVINLAMTSASGGWAVANRGAAGVAEGILYWLLASMIARSLVAERWSGISLTVMTIVPAALAAILPLAVMRDHGANGAYVTLALLALVTVIASLFLPRALTPLVQPAAKRSPVGVLPPRVLAVLSSAFLFQTCIGATWTYLQPLSDKARHPVTTISIAVACGLAAQVCGSLLAAIVAPRVRFFPALAVGFFTLGLSVWMILRLPGPVGFVSAVLCFAFLSQFLVPFELALTISADPTRRAALIMSSIQMLGASAGPVLASIAMAMSGSVTDASRVSLVALAGAALLALFAYGSRPRGSTMAA
jgi:hypothetical protein